jgi:hypothetical protein
MVCCQERKPPKTLSVACPLLRKPELELFLDCSNGKGLHFFFFSVCLLESVGHLQRSNYFHLGCPEKQSGICHGGQALSTIPTAVFFPN